MFQNIYLKNENLQPSWTNTQLFTCMQNVHMYKCMQTQTQIYVMVMGRHVFLLSKTPEMQETTWLHIFFSKATHAVFWLCSANIHVQEKKKKKLLLLLLHNSIPLPIQVWIFQSCVLLLSSARSLPVCSVATYLLLLCFHFSYLCHCSFIPSLPSSALLHRLLSKFKEQCSF